MREARKTPVQPSQRERDRRNQENPKRKIKDRWDSSSYRRVIHRACEAAGVEKWSPNQLRHSGLTAVERAMGDDAARAVGGHSKLDTTDRYIKRDAAKAVEIMREIG